jgi:hypothetical protein
MAEGHRVRETLAGLMKNFTNPAPRNVISHALTQREAAGKVPAAN